MKSGRLLVITLYLLLTSIGNLFAQKVFNYDLTFYTSHYRFHCVTGSGICISKDDYAKKYFHQIKDTVIGHVYKANADSWDSIAINYPFKEGIDSVVLNIIDNRDIKYPVMSLDLIFIYKQGQPIIISNSGNINKESNEQFKNGKAGEEILFRNIHGRSPDGSTRSLAPLIISIQ